MCKNLGAFEIIVPAAAICSKGPLILKASSSPALSVQVQPSDKTNLSSTFAHNYGFAEKGFSAGPYGSLFLIVPT
ncbi:hypothetical protein NUBL21982_49840 [Klebsiella pneumoniae]|nr:hypothetical protein NUBL21982_49840 [Klebsiella pneumoniae]